MNITFVTSAPTDEEGFKEIATVFRNVAKAETEHERRYLRLLELSLIHISYPSSAGQGKKKKRPGQI